MKITKKYDGKRLLLLIEGRIDTITSQELEKEINEEPGDFESLTLDFNELKYISRAGLRVLIITQKKLNDENIPFEIINVNGTVGEIIQMSGFDKILTIK